MDEVLELYEKAMDYSKAGRVEDAVQTYKNALDKVSGPDAESRKKLIANKIAVCLWNAQRYEEAKPYFHISGDIVPKLPSNNLPFKRALKALQKIGICAELTPKQTKEILEEVYGEDFDEDEVAILDFLQVYYQSDTDSLSDRAVKDGFIHHDWRFGQETDDAPAEFSQVVGGSKPVFKQIGYKPEAFPGVSSGPPAEILTLERADASRIEVAVESLEDIASTFNKELERLSDKRRFVSLDTEGDWYAYYLLDKAAFKSLCKAKAPALPLVCVPGIDEEKWLKS